MSGGGQGHPSPYDNVVSSATRFLVELVAWVAGPWAAADLTGTWLAVIPVLIGLVALPATFNAAGDKNTTGITTPGPIRIAIEVFLLVVAIVSAWAVWPTWAAVGVVVVGVAMLVSGVKRYRWLAQGAPPVPKGKR